MMKYHECKSFFFNQYDKIKNKFVPQFVSKTTWKKLPNIFDGAFINAFGMDVFFETVLKFFAPQFGCHSMFNMLKYVTNSSVFFMTIYYEFYAYKINIYDSAKKVIYHAREAKMIMEEILMQDRLLLEESGYGGDKSFYINLPSNSQTEKNGNKKDMINEFSIRSWINKSRLLSVPLLFMSIFPLPYLSFIMLVINVYRYHLHDEMKTEVEKQRTFLQIEIKTLKHKIRELEFQLGTEENLNNTLLEAKKMVNQEIMMANSDFSFDFPHFPPFYLFLESDVNVMLSSFLQGLISAKGTHIISHFFWPEWIIFNFFISIGILFEITYDEYCQSKMKMQFQKEIKELARELSVLQKNKISIAEAIMIYQKEYLKDSLAPEKEIESPLYFANDHDTMRSFTADHKNSQNFFMEINESNRRKM